jgi:hypothetical protein
MKIKFIFNIFLSLFTFVATYGQGNSKVYANEILEFQNVVFVEKMKAFLEKYSLAGLNETSEICNKVKEINKDNEILLLNLKILNQGYIKADTYNKLKKSLDISNERLSKILRINNIIYNRTKDLFEEVDKSLKNYLYMLFKGGILFKMLIEIINDFYNQAKELSYNSNHLSLNKENILLINNLINSIKLIPKEDSNFENNKSSDFITQNEKLFKLFKASGYCSENLIKQLNIFFNNSTDIFSLSIESEDSFPYEPFLFFAFKIRELQLLTFRNMYLDAITDLIDHSHFLEKNIVSVEELDKVFDTFFDNFSNNLNLKISALPNYEYLYIDQKVETKLSSAIEVKLVHGRDCFEYILAKFDSLYKDIESYKIEDLEKRKQTFSSIFKIKNIYSLLNKKNLFSYLGGAGMIAGGLSYVLLKNKK